MGLEVSEMQENYEKKAKTEKFTEILFSDRSTKNIFCTFPSAELFIKNEKKICANCQKNNKKAEEIMKKE